VDGLGAALTRALASTPLLGAVVGLVTWFPYLLTPASGLDGSWRTALQMATAKGLDFGTEVSFSYGPLGFLENPQVTFDSLAVAAAIYTIPGRVILGIALLYVTRRRFGLIAGLVLSFALGLVMPNVLLPLALASLLAIASVTQQGEEIPEKLLVIAGPALAAIAVLLKINLGLIVLAIVTVAVLVRPIESAIPRWRSPPSCSWRRRSGLRPVRAWGTSWTTPTPRSRS
jgi:hypothetical protein